MSNRTTWRFPFAVSAVRDAAQERADHHAERCAWWADELATAEAKMRSDGLTFREQPVSGGNRIEAVIDPTLSARVSECRSKMRAHTYASDDYAATLAGLTRLGDGEKLELDADDIRHFGLAGLAVAEDDA